MVGDIAGSGLFKTLLPYLPRLLSFRSNCAFYCIIDCFYCTLSALQLILPTRHDVLGLYYPSTYITVIHQLLVDLDI